MQNAQLRKDFEFTEKLNLNFKEVQLAVARCVGEDIRQQMLFDADGATGGTCDVAPIVVSAQVFESDGVTPVSGVLAAGADYSTLFRPAPDCELELAMLSAASAIARSSSGVVIPPQIRGTTE